MAGLKRFWGLWGFVRSVFESAPLFMLIFGAGGVAVVVWGVIYTWAQNLKPIQLWLFGIGTFLFLLVLIRWIYERWQKHNIERLPDLVDRLDVMVWEYIDNYECEMPQDDWISMIKEYGNLGSVSV